MYPSVYIIKPLNTLLWPLLCSHSHFTCVVGSNFSIIQGFLLQGYRLIIMQSGETYRQNYYFFRSLKMLGFCNLASNKHSAQLNYVRIDINQIKFVYIIRYNFYDKSIYNQLHIYQMQQMTKNAFNIWQLKSNSMRTVLTMVAFIIMQCESISILMKKTNIFIEYSSNYTFSLNLTQTASQINPINVNVSHVIANTLPTTNQYFDYFKYLSQEDITCYNYAIGNSSYLLPCPFLLNNDSILRVPVVSDFITKNDQNFKGLNQILQNFIIDNTPYPFPIGAYPYSPISISTSLGLEIGFDYAYRKLGIRLIFVNVTVIIVYVFVIAILVFRTKNIQKEMLQRAPDYNLKRRASDISKGGKEDKQDEESDIDNYEQIVTNQFSLRHSRESKVPSLLSSSRDDKAIMKDLNDSKDQ